MKPVKKVGGVRINITKIQKKRLHVKKLKVFLQDLPSIMNKMFGTLSTEKIIQYFLKSNGCEICMYTGEYYWIKYSDIYRQFTEFLLDRYSQIPLIIQMNKFQS